MRAGEQIDDVEIGRVGQRFTAQPAEPQYHQLRSGHAPMPLLELLNRSIGEHADRGFRHSRIAAGDL